MTPPLPPFIKGLSELASDHPAIICDVWGVLHNGETATPGVGEALAGFRRQGGRVALLTNAPRPSPLIARQLTDVYGYSADCWDTIVTSGDATREMLATRGRHRIHYIGPDRDREIYAETGAEVGDLGDADLALVTGLYDDETETPETYRPMLRQMLERGLPLVCANPDLVVERGGKLLHCAGGIARIYGEMGGEVIYFGKPYRPVYDVARARLSALVGRTVAGKEILAIGDGLPTDVTGAHREGLSLLFITAGIHVADFGPADAPDPARVAAKLGSIGATAKAAMVRLAW